MEDQSVLEGISALRVQPETAIYEQQTPLNTTAPINRLPVELLQATFKIAFKIPVRKKAHALRVLRITHVCHYWRSAAHTHTGFWSSIFIDNTPPAFVAHCIELGGQSLRIYIRLGITADPPRGDYPFTRRLYPKDADSINLLLNIHPERVRTLDVKAPFEFGKLLAPMIGAFRPFFPYIDRLGWADEFGVSPDGVPAIPYPLPRLRHLSLCRNPGTPIIGGISGLKSFQWRAEDVPVRTFVELLRRNQGLESITMRGCTYSTALDNPPTYDPQPVSLSNLKSLTISDCLETVQYIDAPLLSFLPVLRVYHCDSPNVFGLWFSSPQDPSLLLRVIEDSLVPLVATRIAPFWKDVTTFGLHRSAGPPRLPWHRYPEDTTDIWRLLPCLRILEVTWNYGLDEVLQPLVDSAEICPALSRIEITPSSELTDDSAALDFFSKLLESRAACGKHLSEIVPFHKINPDGTPKELDRLHPQDLVRGYSTSPEEAVCRPSSRHSNAFWISLGERCRGLLRST